MPALSNCVGSYSFLVYTFACNHSCCIPFSSQCAENFSLNIYKYPNKRDHLCLDLGFFVGFY